LCEFLSIAARGFFIKQRENREKKHKNANIFLFLRHILKIFRNFARGLRRNLLEQGSEGVGKLIGMASYNALFLVL
jgi:hypothetical protein